ncbi:MAG: hypothetical protein [Bacteriophage sp.]|jgi:hypothetical protein|nr:MAG: hypothetical protein [Bacteriophage sp.]
MRRHQITCNCSAYDFPHRFGGGSCTGLQYVIEKAGSEQCKYCLLNNNGCEVVKGIESPEECGYVIDLRHSNEIYKKRTLNK